MLEILMTIQLLCAETACTYDKDYRIPTITLLDCSLWKHAEVDVYKKGDSTVLIVKRVPCHRVNLNLEQDN